MTENEEGVVDGQVGADIEPDDEVSAGAAGAPADLQEELARLNDRHLRLAAEFDNYRKRAQTQLGESSVRAQAQLVGTLLDVLDDLRRVVGVDREASSAESVIQGVSLVERKLVQLLEEAGLEEIQPEGAAFDPNLMEALQRTAAESEEDDDTVDQVFQRGYRFRGHLVRPARVSVRKYE